MFPAVAGVQPETSRSIKPRERDLGDLRLFFLVRILTRPTNHPRHAACASNYESKPVRPRFFGDWNPNRHEGPSATSSRHALPTHEKSLTESNGRPHDFLRTGAERFCQLCRNCRLELRRVLRRVAAFRLFLPQALERLPLPGVLDRQSSTHPLELYPADHGGTGPRLGRQHGSRAEAGSAALCPVFTGRLFLEWSGEPGAVGCGFRLRYSTTTPLLFASTAGHNWSAISCR